MPSAPGRPGRLFRNQHGAFDLPSVLIGVAVVAILAIGVMALIFGAIPWAQNRAAAQDLAALTTAQGAAKAKDGGYVDPSRMSQLGYLSDDATLDYSVAADESCWVGVTKADSGKHFYTVNGSAPAELTRDTKPECLDGPVRYEKVSSGGDTACGLSSGTLYCWGYNGWGLLGVGTSTSSTIPLRVGGSLAGKNIIDVHSWEYNRCASVSGNQLYCWGSGTSGQLGNESKEDSLVPVAVGGALTGKPITTMASAWRTICAVSEKKLYCWGAGVGAAAPYSLGDSTKLPASASPVLVDGGALKGVPVKSVAVGVGHVCALSTAGKAYCWGNGNEGALGSGNTVSSPLPAAVDMADIPGGTFTDVSAGLGFSCATGAGTAYCWGSGTDGHMGDGKTSANRLKPQAISGALAGRSIASVIVTVNEACAEEASGGWYCWGKNTYGQLGGAYGTAVAVSAVPAPGMADGQATNIALGMYSLCAVEDATAYCRGYNATGGLGDGSKKNSTAFVKVTEPAAGGKSWVDVVLDSGKLP